MLRDREESNLQLPENSPTESEVWRCRGREMLRTKLCRHARSQCVGVGGNRRNAEDVDGLRLAIARIQRLWTELTPGLGNGPPICLTTRGSSTCQRGRPFRRRPDLGEGTSMLPDRARDRARRAMACVRI